MLALSQPKRLAIQESLQREREKKEEQKMEKERTERERASLQETLDRVNEAEEAEHLREENKRRRLSEISAMTEDFHAEQGASTLNDPKPRPKHPKRRYTVTARDIKKKVAEKIKRRGPSRFLGDKSILSQMEEGDPVNVETAFRMQAKSIASREDLTPQE